MTYYWTTERYRIYWPGYPSKRLCVKRTGYEMQSLLCWHLASRTIKQVNEQITTAVLNISRQYNTEFHTHMATSFSVYGHIACSNVLNGNGSIHTSPK